MAGEPVPQADDQRANELVGGIDAVEHRDFAAPQRLHHPDRRALHGGRGDVAKEARAHSKERQRTVVALE